MQLDAIWDQSHTLYITSIIYDWKRSDVCVSGNNKHFFQNVLAILSYFLKISYHFFYDFLSFGLFKVLLYFIINCVKKCKTIHIQCSKKVMSDSLGLMDFAIGLVNPVNNLPNGQLKFSGRIQILLQKYCKTNYLFF